MVGHGARAPFVTILQARLDEPPSAREDVDNLAKQRAGTAIATPLCSAPQ
jgi:hypothetical protein